MGGDSVKQATCSPGLITGSMRVSVIRGMGQYEPEAQDLGSNPDSASHVSFGKSLALSLSLLICQTR